MHALSLLIVLLKSRERLCGRLVLAKQGGAKFKAYGDIDNAPEGTICPRNTGSSLAVRPSTPCYSRSVRMPTWTDSSAARTLLNFDFVDSGVVDLEFRRLIADLKSVRAGIRGCDLTISHRRLLPAPQSVYAVSPLRRPTWSMRQASVTMPTSTAPAMQTTSRT